MAFDSPPDATSCDKYTFYLIAVYDETDYPIRIENGENWRLFWWYNATAGEWPSDETDTLGGNGLAIS